MRVIARLALALAIAASLIGAGLPWAPAARAASCEIPPTITRGRATAAATPATESSIIQVEDEAPQAATPVSLPAAATPGALPSLPDAETILAEELTAVSEAVAACLSEGDAEMVTQLADARYLGQLFGSSVPLSPEDYIAIASELRPVPTRIVSVAEATQTTDDRATALVTQVVGNQLMQAEWTFERVDSSERAARRTAWKLRSERQLPVGVPRGASTIDVAIDDGTFALDGEIAAGPEVVLHGESVADDDHEMLVLRFEDGFTTADLLRAAGPALPENVTYVGEMPVRAGRQADLVLTGLEPGAYTIVCLFPNADGVPYLADGMEAVFTVE